MVALLVLDRTGLTVLTVAPAESDAGAPKLPATRRAVSRGRDAKERRWGILLRLWRPFRRGVVGTD